MRPYLACAIVIGAACPLSADAQAWLRDPGKVYVQTSYFYLRADSFYGPDGNVFDLTRGDYVQHVLAFYAEAGVIERWLQLTLAGELFRRNVLENQGATQGLGDFQIGAWTGLVVKPVRLSFGFLVGLPTGDPSPSAGKNATPEEEAIARSLPTGDGEVDVNFRLALGHSFGGGEWPLQHYVLFEVGYAIRTQGLTDQFQYRGEFGTRIDRKGWDRMLLILRLSGAELLGDPSFGGQTFSGLGEFSVTSPALEFLVRVWNQINVGFAVDGAVRAKNLPASSLFKFTLSWQR